MPFGKAHFLFALWEHKILDWSFLDPKNKEAHLQRRGNLGYYDNLQMTSAPFEILSHNSGIRPTTKDRRPLLGRHTTLKRLHLLNGLGTRGVLMAPLLSEWL